MRLRTAVLAGLCALAALAAVPASAGARATLVVPDVRGQAYVFAKAALEEAGFAWRVRGRVRGLAANVVVAQSPPPGTRVVDTGAPGLVLRLRQTADARGRPDDASPYRATRLVVVAAAEPRVRPRTASRRSRPARPKTVAQAPRAPLPEGELPLPARVGALAAYLSAQPAPTGIVTRHWLHQHAWVVAGARRGWPDGAAALRSLIALDLRLQRRWGVGARSAEVARAALRSLAARRS